MLKVKDEVKLEELEKFGFKFNDSLGKWCFVPAICEYIFINSWDRKICLDSTTGEASSVLFELIEAGLVEKV